MFIASRLQVKCSVYGWPEEISWKSSIQYPCTAHLQVFHLLLLVGLVEQVLKWDHLQQILQQSRCRKLLGILLGSCLEKADSIVSMVKVSDADTALLWLCGQSFV